MKTAFKMPPNQINFETDAAAVLYGEGSVKDALKKLADNAPSDFGKKVLAAENASELKRLLRISDEDVWDECQNRWQFNGALVSASYSKFGETSLRVKNGQCSLVYPIIFGGAPFTIDFWCRPDSSMAVGAWIFRALGTKSSFGWSVKDTSGNVVFKTGTTSASTEKTTNGLTKSAWSHFEVGYKSGTLYYFINGSCYKETLTVPREGRRIYFGTCACFIDSFRLRDGACTHAAAFTPPTKAYSKTDDTIALLNFQ